MKPPDHLTILYDGDCPVCCRKVRFLRRRDRQNRLRFADIRDPLFQPLETGIDFHTLEKKIHALQPDGRVLTGMEVIRAAWKEIGLGWLIAPTGWPGLRPLFDALYRFVAANRHKIGRLIK